MSLMYWNSRDFSMLVGKHRNVEIFELQRTLLRMYVCSIIITEILDVRHRERVNLAEDNNIDIHESGAKSVATLILTTIRLSNTRLFSLIYPIT